MVQATGGSSGIVVPGGADGNRVSNFPTTNAGVQGASALTILAAGGAGVKNRIFRLRISVDTAGLVTIADFTTIKVYLPANGTYTWDFTETGGWKQNTANTAITATNAGGGNVTAYCTYKADA